MGLLKGILLKRNDLKLIVMSATLDSCKFQSYIPTAPIIKIPGRLFPVEIFYTQSPEIDYLSATMRTIMQV